jgi:dephospho-CoA kinase
MPRQRRIPRKVILGITGSFGSGKTTVAKIFAAGGDKLIDADRIAHSLLKVGSSTYKEIICAFGAKILKKNKEIDRRKLAGIVFARRMALKKLNSILHLKIISRIRGEINKSSKKIVILDAPLLLEAGLKGLVDKLVVVNIAREKQVERIKISRQLSRAEILYRIGSQWPLKRKKRLADFIIDNNGSKKETAKQVALIRRLLWKN